MDLEKFKEAREIHIEILHSADRAKRAEKGRNSYQIFTTERDFGEGCIVDKKDIETVLCLINALNDAAMKRIQSEFDSI